MGSFLREKYEGGVGLRLLSKVWNRLLREWWQLSVPLRLRAQGVELGTGVRFLGMPIVSMSEGSRIAIGDRVVLCSNSRFTALGVTHPVVLRTLFADAEIIIGEDTGISGGTICAAVRVELGKECLLGANVTIADTDFHPIQPIGRRFCSDEGSVGVSPVVVGGNVFIGTGSVVLKGLTIGENSVVGAGSVVTKDVPSNSIWAGNPAKHIKKL